MTIEQISRFSAANLKRCESPQGFNHSINSWSACDWFTAFLGEIGEAANLAKKLNRCRDGIPGNKEKEDQLRAMLAEELADAYIYLDLFTRRLGMTDVITRGAVLHFSEISGRWKPSEWFARYGSVVGALGRNAADYDNLITQYTNEREFTFYAAHADLIRMCADFHIDTWSAVVRKFNQKSAEIGYPETLEE